MSRYLSYNIHIHTLCFYCFLILSVAVALGISLTCWLTVAWLHNQQLLFPTFWNPAAIMALSAHQRATISSDKKSNRWSEAVWTFPYILAGWHTHRRVHRHTHCTTLCVSDVAAGCIICTLIRSVRLIFWSTFGWWADDDSAALSTFTPPHALAPCTMDPLIPTDRSTEHCSPFPSVYVFGVQINQEQLVVASFYFTLQEPAENKELQSCGELRFRRHNTHMDKITTNSTFQRPRCQKIFG